ncbi:MAG: hypothetical protein GXP25_04705 [Planctomycetes bacterium]|nr:hypothetical protein [Planctomycetota bacterium]
MKTQSDSPEDERTEILASYGAGGSVAGELLAYNRNVFNHSKAVLPPSFPLPDEPFIEVWNEYAADADERGAFDALKPRLVQLQFPIQAGISETEAYRSATRRGAPTDDLPEATSLAIKRPDLLQLVIHPALGGRVPLLITNHREDFVSLIQALTLRNEPAPVPDSQGASTVSGYNNWDRIRRMRAKWEKENPADHSEEAWQLIFQWNIIPNKALYQDRFILLSDGPYSAVPAHDLGLDTAEWRRLSLVIRREHECLHYLTKRLFDSMQNNLLDEIIADYMGLVGAIGRYRADWFLRFVGVDRFPDYRPGGRLENYRGDPPLSDAAFSVLQALVKDAAGNLEAFDSRHPQPKHKPLVAVTLTYFTLEQLAAKGAADRLSAKFMEVAGAAGA